ncbi:MAG TPA: PKD domain-containing protein [Candidatus Acetothermia bacterium]|nr:PKD domain-containing protein [Candidatus Acetothermia bacterium]
MKRTRLYLLLGMLILVVLAITGCLGDTQSAPKAVFSASQVREVIPFTANFDATLSYDSNGQIKSYLWDFGDGASGQGAQVTHNYDKNGTYRVSLTVIDNHGASGASSLTVQALNIPPTAKFSYSPKSQLDDHYIVGASEWITFDASASTDDQEIVSYSWNFGDGWKDEGQIVKHRFLWAGTYNIALTVTDNDGGKTTYVHAVRVMGGPPCNADLGNISGWNAGGHK